MTSKNLIYCIGFIIFDALSVYLFTTYSGNSTEGLISFAIGIQPFLIHFYYVTKDYENFTQAFNAFAARDDESRSLLVRVWYWLKPVVLTSIYIILFTIWSSTIFPGVVKVSLANNGIDTTATIKDFTMYHLSGYRGGLRQVDTIDEAQIIKVTLRYGNTTSLLSIDSDSKNFQKIYQLSTSEQLVPIRYISWFPKISHLR